MKIPCPHAEKNNCERKLEPILDKVSFSCLNPQCSKEKMKEFYLCAGGKLLTKKEFFEQRKEYNGI